MTSTREVETVRLDDVPETASVDLLKIDIQGGELMVFQNAERRLADALVIQTEVEFLPECGTAKLRGFVCPSTGTDQA